jgi:hypothetical protein
LLTSLKKMAKFGDGLPRSLPEMKARGTKPTVAPVLPCARGDLCLDPPDGNPFSVRVPNKQVIFAISHRFIKSPQSMELLFGKAEPLVAIRQVKEMGA